MGVVYVLLIILYLQGGGITTDTTVTHSLDDCKVASILQAEAWRKKGVFKIDKKDVPIEQVEPYCIGVERRVKL